MPSRMISKATRTSIGSTMPLTTGRRRVEGGEHGDEGEQAGAGRGEEQRVGAGVEEPGSDDQPQGGAGETHRLAEENHNEA